MILELSKVTKKNLKGIASPDVAIVSDAENLIRLKEKNIAAVIWHRNMPVNVQKWLDQLPVEQLPEARVILPINMVHSVVNEIMSIKGLPDCPERKFILDEIISLASTFSSLCGSPYLRLRFDVMNSNKCPNFHIDHVAARLLCTYRGVGTEYSFLDDHNEPTQICSVPKSSVIVLRGTKWPTGVKNNLVHRSPEIKGNSETRLMLALDPIYNLEDENEIHYPLKPN